MQVRSHGRGELRCVHRSSTVPNPSTGSVSGLSAAGCWGKRCQYDIATSAALAVFLDAVIEEHLIGPFVGTLRSTAPNQVVDAHPDRRSP
jgi:hypothetical protein